MYIAYLDDIVMHFVNSQIHTQDVQKVLQQLLKRSLNVKLEKLVFRVEKTRFLRFVLTTQGVKIKLSCMDTIKE